MVHEHLRHGLRLNSLCLQLRKLLLNHFEVVEFSFELSIDECPAGRDLELLTDCTLGFSNALALQARFDQTLEQ